MINKQRYINILQELDHNCEDGMAYLSEDDTFRALIPELGLGDGNFETPYKLILENMSQLKKEMTLLQLYLVIEELDVNQMFLVD